MRELLFGLAGAGVALAVASVTAWAFQPSDLWCSLMGCVAGPGGFLAGVFVCDWLDSV